MSLEKSYEYRHFRSSIAQKKIFVDSQNEEMWTIFDAGPKTVKYPIIFLPPCSGTADIYFKVLLLLSSKGYRAISVNYPIIWNHEDWCVSFVRLLDKLNILKVHLFGASLGGFLAQKFAEFSAERSQMVISMILCNTFFDTTVFNLKNEAKLFWLMPRYLLRNTLLEGIDMTSEDPDIEASVRFIKNKLLQLSQSELASRLTLNCKQNYVNSTPLQNLHITIIDVCDENALTSKVNFELIKCYPNAKRAHMKNGGNFPFLSHCPEVILFVEIHFNEFIESPFLPRDNNNKTEVNSANLYNSGSVNKEVISHTDVVC